MNLLLFEPHELSGDGTVSVSGPRAQHVRAILRAIPGQIIRIGCLKGPRGKGTLINVTESEIRLACEFETRLPPRPSVDLLLALPRPKVMRRLWAQLAALGVGRIILTNAAKVERMYFDAHVLQSATYRPLLVEGLQQAGDTWLPEVSVIRRLKPMLEDDLDQWCPDSLRLVADPAGRQRIAAVIGASAESTARRVLLAVGPEGGWTAYELDLLQAHGFQTVSMGSRTLRTDTACVALLTLVHDAIASGKPSVLRK